ncbi:MAG: DAPG hydrolase family protein [Candidatus Binatia bacterium]
MTTLCSFQALPFPEPLAPALAPVTVYPTGFRGVPIPVALPWGLKSYGSAASGFDELPDGRTRFWIRHEVLKDVTPRMLAWWFANLEGDVVVGGRPVHRYRLWHPYDHIHVSYARRRSDGTVGPGAAIRIKEILGGNPNYLVDITSEIEKLDEEGFIHNPVVHGVRGLARMEYSFRAVPGGTLYENCLLFGSPRPWFRLLRPVVRRLAFPEGKGETWLRHNIEEVGMLENFLPDLYRKETGLDG